MFSVPDGILIILKCGRHLDECGFGHSCLGFDYGKEHVQRVAQTKEGCGTWEVELSHLQWQKHVGPFEVFASFREPKR